MRETRLQAFERGQFDGTGLLQHAPDTQDKLETLARGQVETGRKGTVNNEYWRGFLSAVERRPEVAH